MKTRSRLCLMHIIVVSVYSCAPGLHLFNTTNPPCISSKNTGVASVNIGASQIGAQAAVSILEHTAIMGNASVGLNYSEGTKLFEGGIGYYQDVGNDVSAEIYLGGGAGERKYYGLPPTAYGLGDHNLYDFQTNYTKAFIQPAIFSRKDHFEWATSIHVGAYFFSSINYNEKFNITNSGYTSETHLAYSDVPILIAMQPALTLRFLGSKVKIVTQLSGNFFVNGTDALQDITKYIPLNRQLFQISFGLQMRFGKPKD